jgi:hypothetical protein
VKIIRWAGLLLAIVLLAQAAWWLLSAQAAAPSFLDGLTQCGTTNSPFFIGVNCSSSRQPVIPLGVSILINVIFATVLIVLFPDRRSGEPA